MRDRAVQLAAAWVLVTCASTLHADIVINEIHYDQVDKTVPEEFIELYNNGIGSVNLSGWYFSDGIEFTFPADTLIASGEYVIVAQNPTELESIYGDLPVYGPWTGRLRNQGETIRLRDSNGFRRDEVAYKRGFPWPTAGGDGGYSIELLNPDLDNDLGGNWRVANPSAANEADALVRSTTTWRYFEGTEEASNPRTAWREVAFNDNAWSTGRAPIGYGEGFITTDLDMRNNYSTFFVRQEFQIDDLQSVRQLLLEVQFDDGFNAYINGEHVQSGNVGSDDTRFDDTANSALEELGFVSYQLTNPGRYLVEGTNVLAVHVLNASQGGSSDAFFDARLSSSGSAGAGPTPGASNAVLTDNPPPAIRQVSHLPAAPTSDDGVFVTLKASDADGVSSVQLEYQTVDPGAYIELNDAAYDEGWQSVVMNDSGGAGDQQASDEVWSVILPASVQEHRRLVRYRFIATDTAGNTVRVPYADDPSPNFAYFVYDGVPSRESAFRPGHGSSLGQVVEYPADALTAVPVYHLITKNESAEDATWLDQYRGSDYPWTGTLVAEGRVYDHINYRARGGVWRYAMGKNMWKFNFLRGHSYEGRDDYRRKYPSAWDKLNFSALIQQGNFLHRGEQGLFESTGFRMFGLTGVEAPNTHYVHFRIIDEAAEFGGNQYGGDFWGLYLAIEQMDGRFLDQHDLPDGNLYKMESGTGTLNNQGATLPTNRSDLNSFLNTYESSNPSDQWYRENLDLERYYNYRAIVEGIHHYDIAGGKNYFYFHNPDNGKWSVLPWDLDLTWANNMFGSGNEPFKSRVLGRAAFSLEYKNRMREIRDLLYNPLEMGKMIDEFAAVVKDPSGAPSIIGADRSQWDYNPLMINSSIVNTSKAGHGRYYERGTTRTFEGMMQTMKNYVSSRGSWIDTNIANDSAIPRRPQIAYIGPDGHPVDELMFRSTAFSDPQGAATFGAVKWRLAEVSPADADPFDPMNPKLYEIEAAWESPELEAGDREIQIPAGVAKIGSTYRARVRMKDNTGRWSNWSNPTEFVAGEPSVPFVQQSSLRISELMYNAPFGSDYEFIELTNIGSESIDLTAVAFRNGIEFDFADGEISELGPGEYVVVVSNRHVFESTYDTADIAIAGEYRGNLDNSGERVELVVGANASILDFRFEDDWYPLTDGIGFSMHIIDAEADPEDWGNPNSWQASNETEGSPGFADGAPPTGGRRLPGDGNEDSVLDLSDAIVLLLHLFDGEGRPLPCDGGSISEGGNAALFDSNGDTNVNLTDAIHVISYLYQDGPAPVLGTRCVRIDGCESNCSS